MLKRLLTNSRGEIATILTLTSVIIMALGAYTGAKVGQLTGAGMSAQANLTCPQVTGYPKKDCSTPKGSCSNYGSWSYECVKNATCPLDSKYGVALPMWCDGRNRYVMNTDGECDSSQARISSGQYCKPPSPAPTSGDGDQPAPTTGGGTRSGTTGRFWKEDSPTDCFHLGLDISGESRNKVGYFNSTVKIFVDDGSNAKHIQFFVGGSSTDKLSHPWIGNNNPYVVMPEWTESPAEVPAGQSKTLSFRVKIDECADKGNEHSIACAVSVDNDGNISSNCPEWTGDGGSPVNPTSVPGGGETDPQKCSLLSDCEKCIFAKRPDFLPFYKDNGWDVTCKNMKNILTNWKTMANGANKPTYDQLAKECGCSGTAPGTQTPAPTKPAQSANTPTPTQAESQTPSNCAGNGECLDKKYNDCCSGFVLAEPCRTGSTYRRCRVPSATPASLPKCSDLQCEITSNESCSNLMRINLGKCKKSNSTVETNCCGVKNTTQHYVNFSSVALKLRFDASTEKPTIVETKLCYPKTKESLDKVPVTCYDGSSDWSPIFLGFNPQKYTFTNKILDIVYSGGPKTMSINTDAYESKKSAYPISASIKLIPNTPYNLNPLTYICSLTKNKTIDADNVTALSFDQGDWSDCKSITTNSTHLQNQAYNDTFGQLMDKYRNSSGDDPQVLLEISQLLNELSKLKGKTTPGQLFTFCDVELGECEVEFE